MLPEKTLRVLGLLESLTAHPCWALSDPFILGLVTWSQQTRREHLKSALYPRLKKRETFFWQKLENFENFFFRKMSHSAKKCKRGDPFGFINIHSVAKYEKTRRGDPLGTLKKF